MDDIARAAGYSKATLYVYFTNKEEIISLLALESMEKLRASLAAALEEGETTWAQYQRMCQSLTQYQRTYPFYFQMALDKLNIDFTSPQALPEEAETYRWGGHQPAGAAFLQEGMSPGGPAPGPTYPAHHLPLLGHSVGALQLADKKGDYLQQA